MWSLLDAAAATSLSTRVRQFRRPCRCQLQDADRRPCGGLVGNEDIVRRGCGSPVVVHRELEHDQTTIERPLAVRPGNRESGSGYLRRDGDRAVAVVDDPGVLLATVSANRDHLAIRPGEGAEE